MKERVLTSARRLLLDARNADGGWAYARGRRSRVEPTCWALLALDRLNHPGVNRDVLLRWPRQDGLPIDVSGAPANYAFAALTGVVLMSHQPPAAHIQPIVARLLDARGIKTQPTPLIEQDHDLQGWSWVDGTASWVEPTAWALLLLKRARHLSLLDTRADRSAADERIAVAERLLADRACAQGGWNYGNRRVFGQDLWPYVPTTALALLALQDRPREPFVMRGLDQLQIDAVSERSVLAVSLALIAFRVYGVPHEALERTLLELFDATPGEERSQSLLSSAMFHVAIDYRPNPLSL